MKIISNDSTGSRAEFYTANGAQIKGVCGAEIVMHPLERTVAKLEITCVGPLELEAEGVCLIRHPETGQLEQVGTIKFKDGTIWNSEVIK